VGDSFVKVGKPLHKFFEIFVIDFVEILCMILWMILCIWMILSHNNQLVYYPGDMRKREERRLREKIERED